MSVVLQSIKHHIHYYLRARHRRGHGVHSPFAYGLIAGIIEEKHPYYCYSELESIRAELEVKRLWPNFKRRALEAKSERDNTGQFKQNTRQSGSDVRPRQHYLTPSDAQLLFRLVNAFALKNVMEWGGIDEITRLYLQRASSKLEIYQGGQESAVLPELLYCNANLAESALSLALEQALIQKTEQSFLVLAGPHSSAGAYRCWQQLLSHSDVRLSVEMKGLGLVFFNPELQKNHYILRH